MRFGATVIVILLLTLSAISILPPISDADDVSKTYVSADAEYGYRTFGTGSETSPYRSEITGIGSDVSVLFIQSALEGYGLTTITSVGSCNSKTLVIPRTVTEISDAAFDSCTQLTRLVFIGDRPEGELPKGVKIVSLSSSKGWGGMSEVYDVATYEDQFSYFVLDGEAIVLSHGESADVTIPAKDKDGNGFVRINDESFRNHGLKNITFGDVSAIGTRAFYGCTSLESVTFSSKIRTISDEAFRECYPLKDVDITGVTWIGFESFRDCRSFQKIVIPDSLVMMGEGSFYLCRDAESITVGKGITELPARTFGYCTSLTSVEFSDITAVGASAFITCRELVSMSFDDSLTSIGNSAFRGCSKLTDVSLGGNLRTIADNAFTDCLSLAGLDLPKTLEEIGKEVFFHCNSLTDVWFAGGMPTMPEDPFYGAGDVTVHITKGNSSSWSSYEGKIVIEGNDDNAILLASIVMIVLIVIVAGIFIYFIRKKSKLEGKKG